MIWSFIAGSLSALFGVIIGAYAVFKTKRDPYEPFFSSGGKGDAFNLEDDYTIEDSLKTTLPPETAEANNAFVDQFAKNLAGEK